MVETKVLSVLETGTREAANKETVPVYEEMEKVEHHAVARGAFCEVILVKVDDFTESQNFFQQLKWNFIKI